MKRDLGSSFSVVKRKFRGDQATYNCYKIYYAGDGAKLVSSSQQERPRALGPCLGNPR